MITKTQDIAETLLFFSVLIVSFLYAPDVYVFLWDIVVSSYPQNVTKEIQDSPVFTAILIILTALSLLFPAKILSSILGIFHEKQADKELKKTEEVRKRHRACNLHIKRRST